MDSFVLDKISEVSQLDSIEEISISRLLHGSPSIDSMEEGTEANESVEDVPFDKLLDSDVSEARTAELLGDIHRSTPQLDVFSEADLGDLASILSVLRLSAGEIVMKAGETASFCGVVLSGRMSVSITPAVQVPLSPGQVLGEMAYFEESTRSADVTADVDDTLFGLITYDDLLNVGLHRPVLQGKFIHLLASSSIFKLRAQAQRDKQAETKRKIISTIMHEAKNNLVEGKGEQAADIAPPAEPLEPAPGHLEAPAVVQRESMLQKRIQDQGKYVAPASKQGRNQLRANMVDNTSSRGQADTIKELEAKLKKAMSDVKNLKTLAATVRRPLIAKIQDLEEKEATTSARFNTIERQANKATKEAQGLTKEMQRMQEVLAEQAASEAAAVAAAEEAARKQRLAEEEADRLHARLRGQVEEQAEEVLATKAEWRQKLQEERKTSMANERMLEEERVVTVRLTNANMHQDAIRTSLAAQLDALREQCSGQSQFVEELHADLADVRKQNSTLTKQIAASQRDQDLAVRKKAFVETHMSRHTDAMAETKRDFARMFALQKQCVVQHFVWTFQMRKKLRLLLLGIAKVARAMMNQQDANTPNIKPQSEIDAFYRRCSLLARPRVERARSLRGDIRDLLQHLHDSVHTFEITAQSIFESRSRMKATMESFVVFNTETTATLRAREEDLRLLKLKNKEFKAIGSKLAQQTRSNAQQTRSMKTSSTSSPDRDRHDRELAQTSSTIPPKHPGNPGSHTDRRMPKKQKKSKSGASTSRARNRRANSPASLDPSGTEEEDRGREDQDGSPAGDLLRPPSQMSLPPLAPLAFDRDCAVVAKRRGHDGHDSDEVSETVRGREAKGDRGRDRSRHRARRAASGGPGDRNAADQIRANSAPESPGRPAGPRRAPSPKTNRMKMVDRVKTQTRSAYSSPSSPGRKIKEQQAFASALHDRHGGATTAR